MSATIISSRRRWWLASVATVALATPLACSKSPTSDAPPSPSASASVASSTPQALPGASAPMAAAGAPSTWTGAYTAKVGAVDPPKNANEKTWTNDPGSVAIGKGTLELSISAPRGEVTGESTGPLGDMIVAGTFDGHELRANLAPKDPKADNAMTGFLLLTGEGTGPLRGTMRVSGRDGRIAREASVEITKK